MTQFELESLIQRTVKERVGELRAEFDLLVQQREAAEAEADKAVVDGGVAAAAKRSGMFRPGSEPQLVAAAKRAGWRNCGGHLLQLDDQGRTLCRDIGEWLTEERGNLVPLLSPNVVCVSDQKAFSENLDKIASGEVQVATR